MFKMHKEKDNGRLTKKSFRNGTSNECDGCNTLSGGMPVTNNKVNPTHTDPTTHNAPLSHGLLLSWMASKFHIISSSHLRKCNSLSSISK